MRSALGLVLVAVLNLAFQPCAMAMDMDTDHGCPHCPTEARHDNHESEQRLDQVANCDFVDIYSHDSRPAESQGKDHSQDPHTIAAAIFSPAASTFPRNESRIHSPIARHPGDPPLSILYCAFLK